MRDTESDDGSTAAKEAEVTDAVRRARRGLRSDVARLIEALDGAALLVPLAREIEGVDLGVTREVGEELSLSPHLLFDAERVGYLPVFTRHDLVTAATARVGWTTGEGPLEFCTLPSRVVLELGLSVTEDRRVGGMLLNPFDDTELLLRRHEIASLAQGKPLPLVGYVSDIPEGDEEERLVAKLDGPPPPPVVQAIEAVLASAPGTAGYTLNQTFNPERDLEPHLTLNVRVEDDGVDRGQLAESLSAALDGKLPPPGYIDILFNDPLLR